MTAPTADSRYFNSLKQAKADHPHLQTMISIGSWQGFEQFESFAHTAEGRAAFAQSAAEFVAQNQFSGLDLVMGSTEPQPNDTESMSLLVSACRSALDALPGTQFLSVAISAEVPDNYDLKSMDESVDWFNILAFGYNGPWSNNIGHVSPLYPNPKAASQASVSTTVQTMLAGGMSTGKVVLGISPIGRAWANVADPNNGMHGMFSTGKGAFTKGTGSEGNFTYDTLKEEYINKSGYTRYWDDVSKVPYLSNGVNVFSYEDMKSMKLKAQYIHDHCLGGVMFWSWQLDPDGDGLKMLYESSVEDIEHDACLQQRTVAPSRAPDASSSPPAGFTVLPTLGFSTQAP